MLNKGKCAEGEVKVSDRLFPSEDKGDLQLRRILTVCRTDLENEKSLESRTPDDECLYVHLDDRA